MQFNDLQTISHAVQCRSRPKYAASSFGIEIELESSRQDIPLMYGNPNTPHPWLYHEDQSLAPGGCEYVTNGAIALQNIPEKTKILVDFLGDLTEQHKFDIVLSRRTGLHYHSNVEHLTPIQYMKAYLAYLLLEPLMVTSQRFREDNLFCLPTWASPSNIHTLTKELSSGVDETVFSGRAITHWLLRESQGNRRYRAINTTPISRGSIEFRCFESTLDEDILNGWPKLLLQAAKIGQSTEFREFRDIVARNEAIEWTLGHFGTNDLVKAAIPKAMKFWSNELLDLVFQLAISLHIYEDKLMNSNPEDLLNVSKSIQSKTIAPRAQRRHRGVDMPRPLWNVGAMDDGPRDVEFDEPREPEPDEPNEPDYANLTNDELLELIEEGDEAAQEILDNRRAWDERVRRAAVIEPVAAPEPAPEPDANPDPWEPLGGARGPLGMVNFVDLQRAQEALQQANAVDAVIWNERLQRWVAR